MTKRFDDWDELLYDDGENESPLRETGKPRALSAQRRRTIESSGATKYRSLLSHIDGNYVSGPRGSTAAPFTYFRFPPLDKSNGPARILKVENGEIAMDPATGQPVVIEEIEPREVARRAEARSMITAIQRKAAARAVDELAEGRGLVERVLVQMEAEKHAMAENRLEAIKAMFATSSADGGERTAEKIELNAPEEQLLLGPPAINQPVPEQGPAAGEAQEPAQEIRGLHL
jgi:hypothetical protein